MQADLSSTLRGYVDAWWSTAPAGSDLNRLEPIQVAFERFGQMRWTFCGPRLRGPASSMRGNERYHAFRRLLPAQAALSWVGLEASGRYRCVVTSRQAHELDLALDAPQRVNLCFDPVLINLPRLTTFQLVSCAWQDGAALPAFLAAGGLFVLPGS